MELVTQVRAGMKQRMMDAEWLDSETRQLALEKVCGIRCANMTCLAIILATGLQRSLGQLN